MVQLYLLCFSSLDPSLAVLATFNIWTYTFGYDELVVVKWIEELMFNDSCWCNKMNFSYDSNFNKAPLKLAPNKIIFKLAHDLSFLFPTKKSFLLHPIIHSFRHVWSIQFEISPYVWEKYIWLRMLFLSSLRFWSLNMYVSHIIRLKLPNWITCFWSKPY